MNMKSIVCVIWLNICLLFSVFAQQNTSILRSEILQEDREYWVQLPENYDPSGNTPYPVIYILDGSVQLNKLATVHSNYWGHYLPDAILVGISNQVSRTRDLTPSQIEERRGAIYTQESGGADRFLDFMEKEFLPHIDQNYPTSTHKTLIGHSYAGLFTIYTLLNYSHLFNYYIAADPSLDWDNQLVLKQAKGTITTKDLSGKALFISLAAEQIHLTDESVNMSNVSLDTTDYTLFARSILEFAELASNDTTSGLKFDWKIYPQDLHGTVVLPTLRDGLIFLFDWYQLETPSKFNNFETPLEELKQIIERRAVTLSKNFGYPTVPMEEELFNMMGNMAIQFDQMEKAHAFFQMNIEYFPKSPLGYASMSEYFEYKKDYKKALEFLSKAIAIDPSPQYMERKKSYVEILGK